MLRLALGCTGFYPGPRNPSILAGCLAHCCRRANNAPLGLEYDCRVCGMSWQPSYIHSLRLDACVGTCGWTVIVAHLRGRRRRRCARTFSEFHFQRHRGWDPFLGYCPGSPKAPLLPKWIQMALRDPSMEYLKVQNTVLCLVLDFQGVHMNNLYTYTPPKMKKKSRLEKGPFEKKEMSHLTSINFW